MVVRTHGNTSPQKNMFKLVVLLSVLISFNTSSAENILIFVTAPFVSHQSPFRALAKELSLKGHNVTFITTVPLKDPDLKNLTEIDVSYNYEIAAKHKLSESMTNDTADKIATAVKYLEESWNYVVYLPEIQKIIEGKDTKYDVMILEAQFPHALAVGWKLQCPVIAMSSLEPQILFHVSSGNSIHPVLSPDRNIPVGRPEDMSFYERLISLIFNVRFSQLMLNYYHRESQRLRTQFGDDMPELWDLQKNISMLFVTTTYIFHNLRAVNPNTIFLAHGMHVTPPHPLPKDLQELLDNSKEVIYVSFGNNVKLTATNVTAVNELISTFAELPYTFILKLEGTLEMLPKNVFHRNWFPQQDILRHPNVKLFINQGGLQSLQEGLVNNIPMIGIPFFGDQTSNVIHMANKGFGLKINKDNITKEALTEAVFEVMSNYDSYRLKARKYSSILKDTQVPDLDKAIWWTEYVIRHDGAEHLRSPSVNLPFWKNYLIDVIGFISLILYLIVLILGYMLYRVVKFVFRKIRNNSKKHKD